MTKVDLKEILQNFIEINGHPNLIVIDQKNKMCWEDWVINVPHISVDFSQPHEICLEEFVSNVSSKSFQIIFIKNIDKIQKNKDKEYWESIVTIALKQEEYPIMIETREGYYKTFILPFDKIKIITTCSQYPEFLKGKGMLGYMVDLS